ncbi:MAG: epoxyqueuosine reductase [Candidatus Tectomicrobia bacterium]|uniref:Epoxyqueuosine reductase n=1 Tax=Tectimicrobiota bacterium TaxID=2528274 RepID=A0A933GML5_UNCTE|nr:epoxyqueuosine reductase [Candidatus Tectomicrobia bacterium]
MRTKKLTDRLKSQGQALGADLIGVCQVGDLALNREEIEKVLPASKYVVVIAVAHSRSIDFSANIQVKQYDTVYTYEEVRNVSLKLVRFLEKEGFKAVAVPSFIPIDMGPEKKGMRGAISWRHAAVAAGLGCLGASGLFLSRVFGPRIRLGGLVTNAPLQADAKVQEQVCLECGECLKSCPVGALKRYGKVDKKLCGDRIFSFGLRKAMEITESLLAALPDQRREIIKSYDFREIWQTLMVGNYYYCWNCVSACPVGVSKNADL